MERMEMDYKNEINGHRNHFENKNITFSYTEVVSLIHKRLRARFFKKIHDWSFKSERIQKWILRFFTKRINPRSLGSCCVKGAEESTCGVDSSVPLTHRDPRDIELTGRPFLDLEFLKETHP